MWEFSFRREGCKKFSSWKDEPRNEGVNIGDHVVEWAMGMQGFPCCDAKVMACAHPWEALTFRACSGKIS